MKKIRVLVAEDHHVVREGLVSILNRAGDMAVVAEAKDGAEAVAQFKTTRPDVAMLDLEMPQLSGLEAIRQIREHDPRARIVILTTYAGDERIHRALGLLLRSLLSLVGVHPAHRARLSRHPAGQHLAGSASDRFLR